MNKYSIDDQFSSMEGSINNIVIMDCTNYPNTLLIDNSKSKNILFEKGEFIFHIQVTTAVIY